MSGGPKYQPVDLASEMQDGLTRAKRGVDAFVRVEEKKKEISDKIEIAEKVADAHIRLNDLENTIGSDGTETKDMVEKLSGGATEIFKDISSRASNPQVAQALGQTFPAIGGQRKIAMADRVNAIFKSEAKAKYEGMADKLTTAIMTAPQGEQRDKLRTSLGEVHQIMAQTGLVTPEQAQEQTKKANQAIDKYDVHQRMETDPKFAEKVINNPAEAAKEYKYLTPGDLLNVGQQGIAIRERNYTQLQRERKLRYEKSDANLYQMLLVPPTEGSQATGKIRRVELEEINRWRQLDMISEEAYRFALGEIRKDREHGGVSNDLIKNNFDLRIAADPTSVSDSEVIKAYGDQLLSAKDAGAMLKKTKEATGDEKLDPRFKGSEWTLGKDIIGQTVGKGLVVGGQNVDSETRLRWSAAISEYRTRVKTERDRPHIDIANDIVKKYAPPPKTIAEIVPNVYRNEKMTDGYDSAKLWNDYRKEKDPQRKEELGRVIDRLKQQRGR